RPEEVDLVLTTHLHWDHAGGFTRRDRDGGYQLTFPRARHVVQKSEWDFALAPDPRSRAAYFEEDLLPVAEAGLLEVVDGEAEEPAGYVDGEGSWTAEEALHDAPDGEPATS